MIYLLSGWSPGYQPLADITWTRKTQYAKRWGHEARHFIHDKATAESKTSDKDIAWDRVANWIKHLDSTPEGAWTWFSGVDLHITNLNINIEKFCDNHFDFIAANDCNCINADSFLIKNNYRTRRFLDRLYDEEDSGRFLEEQEAMNTLLSRFDSYKEFWTYLGHRYGSSELQSKIQDELNATNVKVKVVSQKYFNTYDPRHLPERERPPTDGSFWEPGDFVIHMVKQSLEYRLQWLSKM